MAEKASFEQLLATVADGDVEKLKARRGELQKQKTGLQEKLAKVSKELQEVEAQIGLPIRNATKAAQLLGIEVPEEYRKFGGNGGNGERPQGKFYWEGKGHMPFRADVSRAMWRLSPGSGGSVGKRGEGALSSEEFWALVKLEESKVQVGDKNTVTLPNGKEIGFQRVE